MTIGRGGEGKMRIFSWPLVVYKSSRLVVCLIAALAAGACGGLEKL
jgi:hypothetical protein